MKILMTVFLFVMSGLWLSGQSMLPGKIVEAETQLPVAYVNIGLLDKHVGTVSDDRGNFVLENIEATDVVLVSAIGYEPIRIAVLDWPGEGTIVMQPKHYAIPTIEVRSTRSQGAEVLLGAKNKTRGMSIGFGSHQLGTQIGSPIAIEQPTYIKSVNFVLNHAKGDSLLLRVNIHAFDAGRVGESLLTENVYIREKQRKGVISVDVSQYHLLLESDVLLSLEWLKDFDEVGNKDMTFDTKTMKKPRGIYLKRSSSSSFEKLPRVTNKNVCFYLIGQEVTE